MEYSASLMGCSSFKWYQPFSGYLEKNFTFSSRSKAQLLEDWRNLDEGQITNHSRAVLKKVEFTSKEDICCLQLETRPIQVILIHDAFITRIKKAWHFSILNFMLPLSQNRLLSFETTEAQPLFRNELGDDSSFTEWSEWSKCNLKCKQSRKRECIRPEICEANIQKNFRKCKRSQCRGRMQITVLKPEHQNGRLSKEKYMKAIERHIYGQWSDWSPCDSSCYTKRSKRCIMAGICNGMPPKEQYKECYVGGDECEKIYLERNSTNEEYHKLILQDNEHPLDNVSCGRVNIPGQSRITGGRRVTKGSWPWQVIIINELKQPFCGGVLLNERWVLTAAHCTRHKLTVRAGEHDLSHHEGTEQEYSVGGIFASPHYNAETVDSDIALLRMETPFELTHYVQPICLPDEEDELPLHGRARIFTILGWGRRRNDTNYGTDILHQADVPMVSLSQCRAAYSRYMISNRMLCAGFDSGKVDSCRGDSGGPLMDKRADGAWAVYGVTSFGDGCGEKRKYGVYASVLAHLRWLKDIIKHIDATDLTTTEMPTEQTTLLGSQEEENVEIY